MSEITATAVSQLRKRTGLPMMDCKRALESSGGNVEAAEAKQNGKRGCLPGQPAGAEGVGDEYYPTYGNGGYVVARYELGVNYDQSTQLIERGKTTILARATQSVCRFNLDFVGFDIKKIKVDGERASWTRGEHELTVTPKHALERGRRFEVFVNYSGEPTEFVIPGFGRLTVDAVFERDFPVIQGVVLVAAAAYVIVNLTVDVVYSLINPRIRVAGRGV